VIKGSLKKTSSRRGKWRLELRVYEGDQDKKLGAVAWSSKRQSALTGRLRSSFWKALSTRFERAPAKSTETPVVIATPVKSKPAKGKSEAPPAVIPEPTVQPETAADALTDKPLQQTSAVKDQNLNDQTVKDQTPQPTSEAQTKTPPPQAAEMDKRRSANVVLNGELVLFSRVLRYNRQRFPVAENQQLNFIPALRAGLALRVLGSAHASPDANLQMSVEGSIPFAASDAFGRSYTTQIFGAGLGTQVNFHLGEHRLGLLAGYSFRRIEISYSSADVARAFPDTFYHYLMIGPQGTVVITSWFDVYMHAAWMYVLSAGDIQETAWINGVASAADFQITLNFALSSQFSAEVGAALRVHAFNESRAIIPLTSKMAMDSQRAFYIGLRWRGP